MNIVYELLFLLVIRLPFFVISSGLLTTWKNN
jgi:hypothetical protein